MLFWKNAISSFFTNSKNSPKATIYGSFPVETLPGTMLRKKTFYQIGEFIEQIRSSEDLEWRVTM